MEVVSEILATIFICLGIWYFNSKTFGIVDERNFMTKSLFSILIVLVLLFVADKIFFANRDLLSKEMRIALFSLIEKVMLIMFGYYFGKNN
jgi:hypothetical protein